MLAIGMVAAVGVTAAAPASAATTESFVLSSASLPGQSSVQWQGSAPTTLPDPVALSGQLDPTSGAISAAALSIPSWNEVQQGQAVTFAFGEVTPGTATGTYDSSTGAVTLNDSLSLTFSGTILNVSCVSSPINVALSGTYDSTSQVVTLSATQSFTIPQFPVTGSCPDVVAQGLNANPGGVSGSTGNAMTIALHGQFAAGLPTATSLSATPSSPQLAGTTVTLSASVTDPSGAGTPTGSVNFVDNGASIGTEALSSGTATLKTSTLPGGPNQLSVSYSGDPTYAASASSAVPYTIAPLPAVNATLPSSITVPTNLSPPTVTALSTTGGPPGGGTAVTIAGSGFVPGTSVTFGTTKATGVTVANSASITATSPAGNGTVDVTVTTPSGTSSPSVADLFSYGTPTVTGVSPNAGTPPANGAFSVIVTGTNFTSGSTVKFGTTVVAATVNSQTSLTAMFTLFVPPPAGTVDVTVSTPNGTSPTSPADHFTKGGLAVTGVSPNAGPAAGGTTVTIAGEAFTGATAVKFGSASAASFTVNSAASITATAPAGTAGSVVDITVTTPSGTSSAYSADQFTYGAPTVTSISPTAGPAAGGSSVTITGTGFVSGVTVKFRTTAATGVTVVSPTDITAIVPAGSGTVDVTATNPAGTSATSPADQFTYGPTVTGVSPPSGATAGGTSVTIAGTGLTGATAVNFGSVAVTSYTVNSATSITATSPKGSAGGVDVTVTTPGGTSPTSVADQFFYGAPTVTVISPNAGPLAGGTSVTIAGTGFGAASAVKFGSVAATSYSVNGATSITATSPAGASGLIHVVVTTNGGSSSATAAASDFTYNSAPSVASLTPSTGPLSGGTGVTITGVNFTAATGVMFGTAPATNVVVVSPTTITATSPAGSGAVDVTVTSAGGTSAIWPGDQFAYGAPTVTSIAPNSGPAGGGTGVVIRGTGFATGATVDFGTTPATSVTVVSSTELTALSPAGSVGAPVDVTVTTFGGTSVTSSADQFAYSTGSTSAQFVVTITNPASGQAWPNLYTKIVLAGISGQPSSNLALSYQDSSGDWCPLTPTGATSTFTYYLSGVGSSCGSAPGSFPLATSGSLTVPMQLSYSSGTYLGAQSVTTTLYSGTCSSPTSCTQAGSLNGSVVSAATIELAPIARLGVTMTDTATRPATTTIRQGFDVILQDKVAAVASTTGVPTPTGTVSYLVDGSPISVVNLRGGGSPLGSVPVPGVIYVYDTAGLAPGTHTLTAQYSGDSVFSPASLTETFTVLPPPSGTPFTCTVKALASTSTPLEAYVTGTSGTPSPTLAGTNASLTSVGVALDIDPAAENAGAGSLNLVPQDPVAFTLSPGGTATSVSAPNFSGVTGTDDVGTWAGMSSQVPVMGNPGSTVTVGVGGSFSYVFGIGSQSGGTLGCSAVSESAPIASVPVAGNTLTTSPASSTTPDAPVTLTDTVFPVPPSGTAAGHYGQVDFYDGSTDLGTVPVGNTTGTATLTTNSLAEGPHKLTAVWSGGGGAPANTSAPVDLTVGTAPTITTQPTDQSVSPNKTATFAASASGDPTPSVQWQVSTDGGATFTDIPGATDMSYTTPATMLIDNGNQYQAVFNNGVGGNVVTSPATLTVGFSPATTGYRLATSNGGVLAFGTDTNYGSVTGPLNAPIVGMASTPDGGGYWLVAADGGIFTFGDAGFYGSEGGKPLNAPIVGMASTPDGGGYWLVAADGGIFTFGDAGFYGSQGGKPLNAPIVGMDGTPDGQGYWLVASDGGIFTFGDATFSGSEGGSPLNAPITGMAATPDGGGYWLVAADGGIFTFGDATFNGSAAGQSSAPVVGMVPTSDGGGYWIGAQDGGIFTFGNAPFDGSGVGMANAPVVAITQ